MSQASNLTKLQAETKCNICHDDLQDPVTTECGHNFCHTCLTSFSEDPQGGFSCPVCRQPCQVRNLTSNVQLGSMVEMAQQHHSETNRNNSQETSTRCEQHNQVLTFFCEEDLQLLCDQCIGPGSHSSHQVTPVAEAASQNSEKFCGFIKSIKRNIIEIQDLKDLQSERIKALRKKTEAQKQELTSEFERLSRFLDGEQQKAFSRLKQEERDLKQKLSENIAALEHYISTASSLRSNAEKNRKLSDVEMLSTVKDFYQKSESLCSPDIVPAQIGREAYNFPPQYSALQKLIQQFTVQVTLDPETAHPNLLVSEDRKCVTLLKKRQGLPRSSKRFTRSRVVLGIPNFNSGRHYWEVKVGKKPEWAIGICQANLPPGARWSSSAPLECWRILWQGDCFVVSGAADPNSKLKVTTPRTIGVFLDYELGEVSFYSMPEKSHIYTFRDTFTEPVCPYFHLKLHSEPLRLCSASDGQERLSDSLSGAGGRAGSVSHLTQVLGTAAAWRCTYKINMLKVSRSEDKFQELVSPPPWVGSQAQNQVISLIEQALFKLNHHTTTMCSGEQTSKQTTTDFPSPDLPSLIPNAHETLEENREHQERCLLSAADCGKNGLV
ncbi:tripartite motif-containing protein 75-like [Arvicola amphibius]|uniref:tripartite motif-containing protein 75-like n=1 Tax=Arvicola amphibius TaxID=1047088 RepID=UPI001C0A3A83|nr:tripartite motif-containing protein 75-like [Arvicola amphibius]